MDVPLALHPDRLFPADPATRSVARRLHAHVKDLPILSPHSHVPPQWIADDVAFRDPTSLLIEPDHYVTRLLHSAGVSLADLGVGQGELTEDRSRKAFGLLCEHWPVFHGTPVRYWLESQLVDVFGVEVRPSATTADRIYDTIAAWAAAEPSRPRALLDAFDIEVLATTDDPCDDLSHHDGLRADPSFSRRVIPTFRPDRYLEPSRDDFAELSDRIGEVSGIDTATYEGFLGALKARRAYFRERGAVATDHSHRDLGTQPLPRDDAARIYREARAGSVSVADATALRRHLVFEMARMSADDGMTMTLHPGVARNHHRPTFDAYGADVGADIPIGLEATEALAPLLDEFGTSRQFNVVVFTMDETIYSRELAPMAGFYPALYLGAPWWFLDAPDAIGRFRRAVTETAGFSRLSGFIDDTRAFLSIPARHDMSRRLDAVHLAQLVVEHRLEEDEAAEIAHALVTVNPRTAFRL